MEESVIGGRLSIVKSARSEGLYFLFSHSFFLAKKADVPRASSSFRLILSFIFSSPTLEAVNQRLSSGRRDDYSFVNRHTKNNFFLHTALKF